MLQETESDARTSFGNEVTQLLEENPTAPLSDVLINSDLNESLRLELPELMKYLCTPDTLGELLDWSLTLKYKEESSDISTVTMGLVLCRNSTNVLTSICKTFQTYVTQDGRLNQMLLDFISSSPACLDNNIVGNYQRLIEAVVRFTRGSFLDHLLTEEHVEFLISHITCLGYRELLRFFITGLGPKINEKQSMIVDKLLEELPKYPTYFYISILTTIFNQNVIAQFTKHFENIIVTALSFPENDSRNAYLFKLAINVLKIGSSQELLPIVEKYAPMIGFEKKELNVRTMTSFPIFAQCIIVDGKTPLDLYLDYFFVDVSLRPAVPFYNQGHRAKEFVFNPEQTPTPAEIKLEDWQMKLWGDKEILPNPPSIDPKGEPIKQNPAAFNLSWYAAFKRLPLPEQKAFCDRYNLRSRILKNLAFPPTIRNLLYVKTMGVASNGLILELFKYCINTRISNEENAPTIIEYPDEVEPVAPGDVDEQTKWLLVMHRYVRNTIQATLAANKRLDLNDED